MYQVLARKWRPQTFDELVGQKHVGRTLGNAIESDRVAHAYVFAGLRGTGKTSTARILAKALNCERGPTPQPCGECVPCREIAENRALDVLEIDAASRTGVDDIRELQQVINYAPVRDRYKLLIIDEFHMLSKNASNALLKTLEEPPQRVVFVLATTELQKILPTILSRCQVFEFRRVGTRELVAHLRRICDAEKLAISDGALERVARAGEGSVRDSLSVLERVVAFCGTEIGDDDVLRLLGGVKAEVLQDLVRGLAARDSGAMLAVLDGLVDEGHDLTQFWREAIAALRDLMLMRAVKQPEELLARPADEAQALAAAADGLSDQDLARAFQLLAELELALRMSSQPRFMFESALIRLADLGAVRPIEEILETLSSGGPAPASRTIGKTPPSRAPAKPKTATQKKSPTGGDELTARIITSVHDDRPMLAAMLERAEQMSFADGRLSLRYGGGMETVARRIGEKENTALIRRHAEAVAGGPVEVLVSTGDARPEPQAAPAAAAAKPSPPAERPRPTRAPARKPGSQTGGRRSLLDTARGEPGVDKLLREFGAQVVDIKPLAPRAETSPPPDDDLSKETP